MHEDIQQHIDRLIASRKTLLLATINAQQQAEISATPFIQSGLAFYIFISALANHTNNLREHPELSVMLIEDESETQNCFARKRLSFQCHASEMAPDTTSWSEIMAQFETTHGKTVSLLKTLPDFYLFQLTPVSGNYIQGFGQAYSLSGEHLQEIRLQGK